MKKKNFKLLKKFMIALWIIWGIFIIAFFSLLLSSFFIKKNLSSFIHPDSKFYKFVLVRNLVVKKILVSPNKKIEFDLVTANKMINESEVLFKKGYIDLAKETALKGENYMSMLVQDYNNALLNNKNIPKGLDYKIYTSTKKQRAIFRYLIKSAKMTDKKVFQDAYHFSQINYDFIIKLSRNKLPRIKN